MKMIACLMVGLWDLMLRCRVEVEAEVVEEVEHLGVEEEVHLEVVALEGEEVEALAVALEVVEEVGEVVDLEEV